jgi:hypothetical protein
VFGSDGIGGGIMGFIGRIIEFFIGDGGIQQEERGISCWGWAD